MVEIERDDYCAFHFSNRSDGKCASCGLPICVLDQSISLTGEKTCQLCQNITKTKKISRYFQIGMLVVVVGLVFLVWQLTKGLENGGYYIFIPLVLMFIFPYFIRPYLMKLYFKGIEPKESVLPILRYFEASGSQNHFKLFNKFLKKLTEEEIAEMRKPLFSYLIPAIAFNFSKLPVEWETELVENLKISFEDFAREITENYRTIIIQSAVHSSHSNISEFIFYISEVAESKEFLKDYIIAITSSEIISLGDEELQTIYGKLLEDLYLYEEKFAKICDELGLKKEKAKIQSLLARYEPPPVPKTRVEAVMKPEQLREKRRKEQMQNVELTYTEPREEDREFKRIKEVEFKEE